MLTININVENMSLVIHSPVDIFSEDTDRKLENSVEEVIFNIPPLAKIGFESTFYHGKLIRFNKSLNDISPQIRSLKLCQMPYPFVFTLADGSIVMDPTFIVKMVNLEKIEITCCVPDYIIPLLALCLWTKGGRYQSFIVNASTLLSLKRYLKDKDLALKESRAFADRIPIQQRSKIAMFLDKMDLILHPTTILDHKGREVKDLRLDDSNQTQELTVDHLKVCGLLPKKHRNKLELQWATKPYSKIGINVTRISFLPTLDTKEVEEQPVPTTSSFLFFM